MTDEELEESRTIILFNFHPSTYDSTDFVEECIVDRIQNLM